MLAIIGVHVTTQCELSKIDISVYVFLCLFRLWCKQFVCVLRIRVLTPPHPTPPHLPSNCPGSASSDRPLWLFWFWFYDIQYAKYVEVWRKKTCMSSFTASRSSETITKSSWRVKEERSETLMWKKRKKAVVLPSLGYWLWNITCLSL